MTDTTPGPWLATANGLNVKSIDDIMVCFSSEEAGASAKANAAMIAAAPDLFNALSDLCIKIERMAEEYDLPPVCLKDAFAAIRKAQSWETT